MKIKATQLDEKTRRVISRALIAYIPMPEDRQEFEEVNTYELSAKIEDGELILYEYIFEKNLRQGCENVVNK